MHGMVSKQRGYAPDRRLAGPRVMLMLLVVMTGVAPIDRRLIEVGVLSPAEIDWLNAYHARVAREVRGKSDDTTKAWLDAATAPLTTK